MRFVLAFTAFVALAVALPAQYVQLSAGTYSVSSPDFLGSASLGSGGTGGTYTPGEYGTPVQIMQWDSVLGHYDLWSEEMTHLGCVHFYWYPSPGVYDAFFYDPNGNYLGTNTWNP